MVAIEGVPLHSPYFAKLWFEIYHSEVTYLQFSWHNLQYMYIFPTLKWFRGCGDGIWGVETYVHCNDKRILFKKKIIFSLVVN